MANVTAHKSLDLAKLLDANEAYDEAFAAYEAALERGEAVEPPAQPNPADFVTITNVIAQTGKGAPLMDRPDDMGLPIFVQTFKVMDEFCAIAGQYARLHDEMLKAFYTASLEDNRPKRIAQPPNFHDFLSWVPRRVGKTPEGVMILSWTHSSGIFFEVDYDQLKALMVQKGSDDLAVIELGKQALNQLNEPARRYAEINRDMKRYLQSRLTTAHGEEMAKRLFTAPRADNARAKALVDKDQNKAAAELEKAQRLAASLAALDAMANDDAPAEVIDAEEVAPAGEEVAPGVVLNSNGVDMNAAKSALGEFFAADKPADKPAARKRK